MNTRILVPYVLTLIVGIILGSGLAILYNVHVWKKQAVTLGPMTPKRGPHYTLDNKVVVNLTLLASLPNRKRAIAALCEPTDRDSTPAVFRKRMEYYKTLKSYVMQLRQTYYCHDEFPTNIFDGIEQHSDVLVGIEYPFYPSTGCSGYSSLWIDTRIDLCETDRADGEKHYRCGIRNGCKTDRTCWIKV